MGVAVQQAGSAHCRNKIFSARCSAYRRIRGLSGPAVIKLSAWAAVYLHQNNYTFTALVNWAGESELKVSEHLMNLKQENSKKTIITSPQFTLPKRLWEALCIQAGVEEGKIWAEIPNKTINRLIELLYACPFAIKGKTTFKEEFVTCGGVLVSRCRSHNHAKQESPRSLLRRRSA
ncbi:MAG: NAD(P)/FAD-dependent oxidoreductase [Cytophagales bacterium]|nr:NAD(P)/FAD-dependent oxidoreductase [Cytophagales bacterium]